MSRYRPPQKLMHTDRWVTQVNALPGEKHTTMTILILVLLWEKGTSTLWVHIHLQTDDIPSDTTRLQVKVKCGTPLSTTKSLLRSTKMFVPAANKRPQLGELDLLPLQTQTGSQDGGYGSICAGWFNWLGFFGDGKMNRLIMQLCWEQPWIPSQSETMFIYFWSSIIISYRLVSKHI